MVAFAFVAASGLLRRELQRKEKEGWLKPVRKTMVVGKPEGPVAWTSSALLGFVLGWKVLWLLINASDLFQGGGPPQQHLFSAAGYPLLGILGAALMGWLRWKEDVKQRLDKPEEKTIDIHPWERTGNITLYAAVGGVVGAKLFHLLEYPDELVAFFRQPSLQSFLGGLTIYGGLIVGGLAVAWYARRSNPLPPPCRRHGTRADPRLWNRAHGLPGQRRWRLGHSQPNRPDWLSWAPDWVWSYFPQQRQRCVRSPPRRLHRQADHRE